MALMHGTGPFGDHPAGRFNVEIPRDGVLYMEESSRWIRARLGGVTVADSKRPKLLYEQGRLPVFMFDPADVRMDLIRPTERTEDHPTKGRRRVLDIAVNGRAAESAALVYSDDSFAAGLMELRWGAFDEWLEEDEVLLGHPRDPYSRIDVRQTSRWVRVLMDGEVVADTRRAKALFEASSPPRWYIPAEDVRTELLEPSHTRTVCGYKGVATYSHVRIGDRLVRDAVWTYPEALSDGAAVRGMLAFFNERVDIELDGELQERPRTRYSST